MSIKERPKFNGRKSATGLSPTGLAAGWGVGVGLHLRARLNFSSSLTPTLGQLFNAFAAFRGDTIL